VLLCFCSIFQSSLFILSSSEKIAKKNAYRYAMKQRKQITVLALIK